MLSESLIMTLKPQIDASVVTIDNNFDIYFTKVEENFPFFGSKIDWERIKNSVEIKIDNINSMPEVKNKLKDAIGRFCSDDATMITVIGDSAMDFALKMTIKSLYSNIEAILELPQHVYIAPKHFDWCVCISMEGYISSGTAEEK